jgi:hypothetical protein
MQGHFIVRHTGQIRVANADPVSSATVKRRSLLPLIFFKKTKNKTLRVLAYMLDPGSALALLAGPG